eukprot:scaffold596_cov378-Prasinococcus_capsulatus_cf.AAC.8
MCKHARTRTRTRRSLRREVRARADARPPKWPPTGPRRPNVLARAFAQRATPRRARHPTDTTSPVPRAMVDRQTRVVSVPAPGTRRICPGAGTETTMAARGRTAAAREARQGARQAPTRRTAPCPVLLL